MEVEEKEDEEGGSFLGALALNGGDGVVTMSSPSSRGLIRLRGVLITPWIQSSADSLRSSSRSSEQLNERPFKEEGVSMSLLPFIDNLLFFLGGRVVPEPLPPGLLLAGNGSTFGGVLCLPELAVDAATCATADGGDLMHGNASSGSVFTETLDRLLALLFELVFSKEWW